MKKMFCQNNFLNGYVPHGFKKAVLTTIPKMIQQKTKKCSPDVRKKLEKTIFLSKLFFQLPISRQRMQILQQCCKSSAANRTFCRPKSRIVSQSQHNVFVKVILWTRKLHFWQFCWKKLPNFQSFCLKIQIKMKNKHFLDKTSSKSSRDA